MGKVLTYHKQTNHEHWDTFEAYKKKQIDAIIDPERGNTDNPPTSIPSPFAAMDLVKTAFRNLGRTSNLEGTRIDFKLVSHCLDVGELLFNIDKFRNRVQIITWDKEKEINNLLSSPNPGHVRLGEALQLYLDQDALAYNFDRFRQLFLVQFDNDYNKVVGGTSPATLFFTSSNNLEYAKLPMPGNYSLFGSKYTHLYSRDPEFQVFLYSLRKALPNFGSLFREVSEYMDISLRLLVRRDANLAQRINQLTPNDYSEKFDDLTTGVANDKVYIHTFPLRKRLGGDTEVESDFVIKPNSEKAKLIKKLPLVLSKGHDGISRKGKPMKYYNGNFQKGTPVPHYSNVSDINDRNLPGLAGIKYPHLLISDFLEPYLIRLVFPINSDRYFNGNIYNPKDTRGYLIPIKLTYFDYFTVDDLMRGVTVDGKRYFEMESRAGGTVKVTLRIPVLGDYIVFERLYHENINESIIKEPDLANNKGVIVENQFSTTIYPMIQMPDNVKNAHYRVMLVDRDILPHTRGLTYKLAFHNETGEKIQNKHVVTRSSKHDSNSSGSTDIYILNQSFDIIQVNNKLATGLIIPIYKSSGNGNKQFHFAVDFGTTFTHMEYKVGSGSPHPFEITNQDLQTGTLFDPVIDDRYDYLQNERAEYLIDRSYEIFPEKLGEDQEYKFPQRTVIAERRGINFSNTVYAVADFNIPFIYEKKTIPLDTDTNTNLKWSKYKAESEDRKRVKAFFEKLLFMVRAKVILNEGNLQDTEMTWFYPSSMMEGRVNQLESLWNELFAEYITTNIKPVKLSESIAPFYYYREKRRVSAAGRPVVAIDIGGGTSDVVIYEGNSPVVLTSFKFAANSIFGDGFSTYGNVNNNGFVIKYESVIKNLLDSNKLMDLIGVLDNIKKSSRSADVLAFFFSLESNQKIRKDNIPISFSNILKGDDDMRILFIIFYISILYHIAKLMKAKSLEMPRYITFSGNGSRVLQYVSESDSTLSNLAKVVFEKIYEAPLDNDGLQVIRELEKPKEATCKGGLMMNEKFSFDYIEKIKTTLLGTSDDKFVEDNLSYNDLDDEVRTSFKNAFEDFVSFIDSVNKSFRFSAKLNANPSSISKALDLLKKDIIVHLNEGINLKKEELSEEDKAIEETLFFYPLIGSLNQMAYEIAMEDQ